MRILLTLPLIALSAPVAAAPSGTDGFLCSGNEPFWNLDIAGPTAQLRTMNMEDAARFDGAPTALDWHQPPVTVWRGRNHDGDVLVAMVAATGACFDTMADGPAMPYEVLLSLPDGSAVAGCCR